MKTCLTLCLFLLLIGCQARTLETSTPITQLTTPFPVEVRQTSTLVPTAIPSSTKVILTDEPTLPPTNVPVSSTSVSPTQVVTEFPPTATQPIATMLPTLLPTQVATQAIPTPTATRVVPTALPTQTATSSPPPTPVPPTMTATSEPTVNYFRFAAPLTKPSEPALLEWDVQGVTNVVISRNGGEWAEAEAQWNVSSRDSMPHTFPTTAGGWPVTYILTSPDAPTLRAEFTVVLPCEYAWEFAFDYPGSTCPIDPIISTAAFQAFEGGFMVWTRDLDQILFSTWDGLTHDELIDTFDATHDPIRLDWITPPVNYLQPEYGFGKLWRENDFVRQTLGWAVAPTIDFTTVRQGEPGARHGGSHAFIRLPNDGMITIEQPNPSWTISYPKPNVPYAEQRPPLTVLPEMTPTPESGAIVVNYFRFVTEPTKPTDQVLLEWDIDGAETIEVNRNGGEWGEAQATYELSAEGTLSQSFIPELSGWPIFYIVNACNDLGCLEYVYTIELPCEYPIVIAAINDSQGCLSEGIVSNGSQQNFEHGFMIWIEAQNLIIYSTWSGLTHAELVDTFDPNVDPVRDDSIIPPAGFYQPEYGFGKVWREQAGVRDLLGWATDWGASYTVKRQSQPPHRYGFGEWITLNNGGLITINHPNPTWTIE